MDAKPQRPLRALAAVPGNENIIPGKQSIHHRHKSVGNLKATSITGALNAPPKRTAFGDVSNTARPRNGDNTAKPIGKEIVKVRAKTIAAPVSTRDLRLEDKENRSNGSKDSQSYPAIASSKGVSYISKTDSNYSVHTTHPAPRGVSLAQPPLRNGVSKTTTAVYQDRAEGKFGAHISDVLSGDDLAALAVQSTKQPRHYKSQPVLRGGEHGPRPTQNRFAVKTSNFIEVEDEDYDDDIDGNLTDPPYEDAVERLPHDAGAAVRGVLAELEQMHAQSVVPVPVPDGHKSDSSKTISEPAAVSEPEEYWDEEEEQEYYDEQGYTTAHSFRSHGDNTTSGPTTLLAPRVTTDVQDELELAKAHVLEHQTEDEIEEEAWDVSMVAEYGDEIFEYMRDLEMRMQPNAHYMDIQTEIQWSMRSVLMDWLVQVHHRFCLLPETLFLTVNYIDRFLGDKVVSLGKLQLVGATALFLAAKYEEINCPSVQEIVYMVDSGYTVDEILKAERFMLSMLGFEMGWPGPMSFLRRISKADDYDLETRTLAKYFLELTIMDERFVSSPPSFLAAGAHCISRFFLGKGGWTLAHVHYSGYTLSQLKPLIKMLYECCQDQKKHHRAVYDKYATAKYKHCSTFVGDKMDSGVTLAELHAGQICPSSLMDEYEVRHAANGSLVAIGA